MVLLLWCRRRWLCGLLLQWQRLLLLLLLLCQLLQLPLGLLQLLLQVQDQLLLVVMQFRTPMPPAVAHPPQVLPLLLAMLWQSRRLGILLLLLLQDLHQLCGQSHIVVQLLLLCLWRRVLAVLLQCRRLGLLLLLHLL